MLKVIVTGAFSTGKTQLAHTLGHELTARGLTIARLPDVARNCPVPLNSDQTEEATLWLITTQIAREIETSLGSERVMLCDRGLPDILAHHEDRPEGASDRIGLMAAFLERWLSTYDLILFSRVDESIPIEGDGLRVTDAAYRTRLDRCAELVLANCSNVATLPSGHAARIDYAREAVVRLLSVTA